MFDFHTHIPKPDAIVNSLPADERLFYSIGVHPWDTKHFSNEEWDKIIEMASLPQVKAIGETGIDMLRGAPLAMQKEIFLRHVEVSEAACKPLIIHCVRASGEIESLHRKLNPRQAWVIHGFRGGVKEAKRLTDEGLFLSFGEKYIREALVATPRNRILVESDTSSLSLEDIYGKIASDLGITVEALDVQIRGNLKAVL